VSINAAYLVGLTRFDGHLGGAVRMGVLV